ncbi:unnamed protein product [Ectocarpus sp. CCAP 1310/34]|nr:unnamed protein product [Ectocarpus sp. CCAP 1310/34]
MDLCDLLVPEKVGEAKERRDEVAATRELNTQRLPQDAPLADENAERLLDPDLAQIEVERIFVQRQSPPWVRSQQVVA